MTWWISPTCHQEQVGVRRRTEEQLNFDWWDEQPMVISVSFPENIRKVAVEVPEAKETNIPGLQC